MSHKNKVEKEGGEARPVPNGELDLGLLFRSIWKTRGLVVAAMLLSVLGLAALVFLSKLAVPTTQTSQYAVKFVFPGVAKGQYPNGALFARSDVLAPAVLHEVYRQNDLAKYSIKKNEFFGNVSVYPHAQSYDAILGRYKVRLDDKKLTFTERQDIESEMKGELQVATRGSALLRLTLRKRLGISEQLGQKILHDILRQWAQYSIEQRGVLRLPEISYSRKLTNKDILKKYNPLIITEILQDKVNRQKVWLGAMLKLIGANAINDKKSGFTIATLLHQFGQFEQYDISNVRALIISENLAANKDTMLAVLRLRADRFESIATRNEQKTVAIENSFNIYSNRRKLDGAQQSSGAMIADTLNPGTQSAAMPQLGESFLDRLMEIVKQKDDVEFRQKFVRDYVDTKSAAISARSTSERIRRLIKQVEMERDPASPASELTKEKIIASLGGVIATINEYAEVSGRLYEELSSKRMSFNGQLYVGIKLPSAQMFKVYHPIFNKNIYIIFILIALAAAIFAMFFGLIWQYVRNEKL